LREKERLKMRDIAEIALFLTGLLLGMALAMFGMELYVICSKKS